MKIKHSEDYRKLRRGAYKDPGEQLDAIMKLAAALAEQGITLPEETVQWIEDCKAVKERYKKP